MGLAISKRLTEIMGGTMGFVSEPGRGSTFYFALRFEPVPVGPRPYVATGPTHVKGMHVLVVDDNAASRRILGALTTKWGLQADFAENARAALELLSRGSRYDAAILDMQMPEMDGEMLATEIHRLYPHNAPKMALLSSLGRSRSSVHDGLFTAVLHKPAKPTQLFNVLAEIFRASFLQPVKLAPPSTLKHGVYSGSILVAEDNFVNQRVAEALLAKLGYHSDLVANGLEALDALSRHAYEIILLDVQMPELDGLETARRIRQYNRGNNTTPWIIALTANAIDGDRERCLEAGMNDYLSKPISSVELSNALQRARASKEKRNGDATLS